MVSRKLRVFASEDAVLVPNYEALDATPVTRRFVGRVFDPNAGPIHPETDKPHGGWRPKTDPETLSPSCRAYFDEYVGAIKRGELVPADQDTADLAGVPFVRPQISKQPKG